MERQKRVAIYHAQEINQILGENILKYDSEIMKGLWKYGETTPALGISFMMWALLTPLGFTWGYLYIEGLSHIRNTADTSAYIAYSLLVPAILFLGLSSFILGRRNKQELAKKKIPSQILKDI